MSGQISFRGKNFSFSVEGPQSLEVPVKDVFRSREHRRCCKRAAVAASPGNTGEVGRRGAGATIPGNTGRVVEEGRVRLFQETQDVL